MSLALLGAGNAIGNIVGIDPGTETLGVACISIDVQTLAIVRSEAQTFKGSKLDMNPWVAETHSALYARVSAHEANLTEYFFEKQPFLIVSEAPFFSKKFPGAYAPLVLALNAIRNAVRNYHPCAELHAVDPPSVKNAVGAPGNAGKPQMLKCVSTNPELNYQGLIPVEWLDEHSIDALAVAYSKLIDLRGGLKK